MIIKFSDQMIRKAGKTPYTYEQTHWIKGWVTYLLSSKARKRTHLQRWIKRLMEQENPLVDAIVKEIPTHTNPDYQMHEILRWTIRNIKYERDSKVWKLNERWQTPEETAKLRTGDCEDGAILMYALARKKGIPTNRLMIFAGSVVGGGHAWLGYKPTSYPLNWAFMDWCYWADQRMYDTRNLYYINGKTIHGYKHSHGQVSGSYNNYLNMWFCFNEERGHHSLKIIR